MNREMMLGQLGADEPWDVIIVGGGATGLGCAVDAAARGYRTLLLERHDFAQGTSSRSTKLVHGGVRYLEQGNFTLVLEALRERGILRANAPHLVHDQPFVVPNYVWWEAPFYGFGLKAYDLMAGRLGFGKSRLLSKEATIERIPTVTTDGLRGGVVYHDGQFDDARLAIALAQTAADEGATLATRMDVTGLIHEDGLVTGVAARDKLTGNTYELRAKVVINATGPWSDTMRRMDEPDAADTIAPSQGVHIALERRFLPGDSAIMVPHTSDGRVIFVIPWHDRVLVGTTDTSLDDIPEEPRARDEEIAFLLETVARYLTNDPTVEDIKSVFVGIRPLVRAGDDKNTAELSRNHVIRISGGGLVSVAGGKWTTYRKMAMDTIDQAAVVGDLPTRECPTRELRIHGYDQSEPRNDGLDLYGSDAEAIRAIGRDDWLIESLSIRESQVLWAAREEMALTVEDVLARRTRALFLDARAGLAAAPRVAELLAEELGHDTSWRADQVAAFAAVAEIHLPNT